MSSATLYCGDALTILRTLPPASAQCCVTSPPYWGLRDYGMPGQLGLEPTPQEYVTTLVTVFRDVRRVLRDDGTLWLNLGDAYATGAGKVGDCPGGGTQGARWGARAPMTQPNRMPLPGLKPKDLIGMPWRVAFALQADGWWLRSDIVWSKPNPMPESVTDRPTKSHEYVFLLAKAERYYYDADAIRTPGQDASVARLAQPNFDTQTGGPKDPKNGNRSHPKVLENLKRRTDKQRGHSRRHAGFNDRWDTMEKSEQQQGGANARTVWEIATQSYPEAHFATFPDELARRCILAGSRPGDCVLDPFGGSGTVAAVAVGNGRESIYIDLNPAYLELARQRIGPLLCVTV